jgi:hypothetical protein
MENNDFKPYRAESRKEYGSHDPSLNIGQVQLGALLRIADGIEFLGDVLADNKRLKKENKTMRKEIKRLLSHARK